MVLILLGIVPRLVEMFFCATLVMVGRLTPLSASVNLFYNNLCLYVYRQLTEEHFFCFFSLNRFSLRAVCFNYLTFLIGMISAVAC